MPAPDLPIMRKIQPALSNSNKVASSTEKTVYVPVYSEVFVAGGGKLNLAITLSIRNTDFKYPLVVNNVNYYNTAGKLIQPSQPL
jgi:hypothetical protein